MIKQGGTKRKTHGQVGNFHKKTKVQIRYKVQKYTAGGWDREKMEHKGKAEQMNWQREMGRQGLKIHKR